MNTDENFVNLLLELGMVMGRLSMPGIRSKFVNALRESAVYREPLPQYIESLRDTLTAALAEAAQPEQKGTSNEQA